jgi:hypothetical protein
MTRSRKRKAKSLERRNREWWARIVRQEKERKKSGPPDSVARNLDSARKAFEAGNPLGLIDAVVYCDQLADRGVCLPRWALRALAQEKIALLKGEKPTGKEGRLARDRERYRQAAIHYYRYEAVLDCKEHRKQLQPPRGEDIYDCARRLCQGTSAGGSRSAIKNSFKKVRRELQQPKARWEYYSGMVGRFFQPSFVRSVSAWEESTRPILRVEK